MLLAVLALAVSMVAAPNASAHARLQSSTPRDGATVSEVPASVVLVFNEPIKQRFSRVEVLGPGGTEQPPVRAEGRELTVPIGIGAPSSPGRYRLTYRVTSADGHPISGRLTFTVSDAATRPPTGRRGNGADGSTSATPSARQVELPSGGSSSGTPSGDVSATSAGKPSAGSVGAAAGDTSDDGGGRGWLVAIAVLAAVALAGGLAVRRSRR